MPRGLSDGLLTDLLVTAVPFGDDTDELQFSYTVASDADAFGQCDFDISVQGYMPDFSYGAAFYDQEGESEMLTSVAPAPPALSPIVLNEVLAKPHDASDGPTGEWVELYNLSATEYVDVENWEISEISGVNEKKYTITPHTADGNHVRTYTGTTTIPPNGFLIILFNGAKLNDNGDTITLYDQYGNKLDQYTYEQAKLNMSDARIPDGVGDWVDPVPTPGDINIVGDQVEQQQGDEAENLGDPQPEEFAFVGPIQQLSGGKPDSQEEEPKQEEQAEGSGQAMDDADDDSDNIDDQSEQLDVTDENKPEETTEDGQSGWQDVQGQAEESGDADQSQDQDGGNDDQLEEVHDDTDSEGPGQSAQDESSGGEDYQIEDQTDSSQQETPKTDDEDVLPVEDNLEA